MLGRVADRGVVPLMPAKATSRTEGRSRPLGSPDRGPQVQTQTWRPLHRHLVRVTDAVHRSRQTRFTALFHHVDVAALERPFRRPRRRRTAWMGLTVAAYEGELESNLQALHARLQANRYRPLPVRRTYIAKADGAAAARQSGA